MTDSSFHPYARVQLFSGGGARFGYYLGSYAALCAHDLKPDLILATCGGSLSALLIDISSDPQQLKTLAESKTLYQVVQSIQARQHYRSSVDLLTKISSTSKPRYFYHALKRWGLMQRSALLGSIHSRETSDDLLSELNRLAMFEIDNDDYWLDELIKLKEPSIPTNALANFKPTAPDIAIVASRIAQSDIDLQPKQQAVARLQELLFTPHKLTSHLEQLSLHCPTHHYAPQRILKNTHVVDHWDIKQAVRASMADMYYLRPTHIPTLGWCLGGVINLTPIELAAQFGSTVFAEHKSPYDKVLAAPAIRRIFGFDPNRRLAETLAYQSNLSGTPPNNERIHWLPFADNGKALSGQHVRKRLNILNGRIDLIHADYDGFVQQMQAQWQYGYERTRDYLKTQQ